MGCVIATAKRRRRQAKHDLRYIGRSMKSADKLRMRELRTAANVAKLRK